MAKRTAAAAMGIDGGETTARTRTVEKRVYMIEYESTEKPDTWLRCTGDLGKDFADTGDAKSALKAHGVADGPSYRITALCYGPKKLEKVVKETMRL